MCLVYEPVLTHTAQTQGIYGLPIRWYAISVWCDHAYRQLAEREDTEHAARYAIVRVVWVLIAHMLTHMAQTPCHRSLYFGASSRAAQEASRAPYAPG